MSSESQKKVKFILEGLALELLEEDSIPLLADYLGYSKQALYGWIDKGEIPNKSIKSIKSKIPDLNVRYLREGNLPVREGGDHMSFDKLLREERSRYNIEDIPDTELGREIQGVLDDAVSLVLKLRRLSEIEKKLDH